MRRWTHRVAAVPSMLSAGRPEKYNPTLEDLTQWDGANHETDTVPAVPESLVDSGGKGGAITAMSPL